MGDEVQVKEKQQGHVSDTWSIQCCCHSCSQNIVLQQALDKVHKKNPRRCKLVSLLSNEHANHLQLKNHVPSIPKLANPSSVGSNFSNLTQTENIPTRQAYALSIKMKREDSRDVTESTGLAEEE